jgi:Family of unknown function (DUF6298)/Protein of unknown function (DUF4038)
MHRANRFWLLLHLGVVVTALLAPSAATGQTKPPPRASGPLRVHPDNSRYFADASGKAVYLTGAHTWNNLVDMGPSDPPEPFGFDAYLDSLDRHGHNFIRLWAWDSVTWDARANGESTKKAVNNVAPQPWARTGPGNALDGKPKFDLTKFNEAYFERLRDRVKAAGDRGIYVSVMLFEGWGLMHGNRGRPSPAGWAWRGHPFHPENNTSGINADPDGDGQNIQVHSLAIAAVTKVQEAYIHKVVDTVNDLDNVLYEVINEGGEQKWDWWVVKTIRDYERTKPKQHPIGITGHGAERLDSMLASPADWISPGSQDGYRDNPPAWDGKKVSLLDTDHVWGLGGSPAWAWKAFVRGHNPLFMDPYDNAILAKGPAEDWEPLRKSMGVARKLAQRVNLAAMTPHDELVSTKFCLAQPGVAYVLYLPEGGEVTVDLLAAKDRLEAEWIHPIEGTVTPADPVAGGDKRTLKSPLTGPAVLFLRSSDA